MALKMYSAPAVEPVTTSEAKLNLRIDHSTEDTLISSLITLARDEVERMCNVALINQTWDWFLDDFFEDVVDVPFYPLSSVTSIKYKAAAGTESTITNTNYVVDTASRPGRIAWISTYSFPVVELYPLNPITIRFVAGFGSAAANVPMRYIQAIKLLVGHYYENREAIYSSVGGNVIPLPMGVEALLAGDLRRFG